MRKVLVSIGSAAGAAAVAYAVLPAVVAAVMTGVLMAHELGHYVMAWLLDAHPSPPVFVPLGIVLIGITTVDVLSPHLRRWVLAAGPLTGLSIALALVALSALIGSLELALVAGAAAGYEVVSGTLGTDGRKFRTSSKEAGWKSLSYSQRRQLSRLCA